MRRLILAVALVTLPAASRAQQAPTEPPPPAPLVAPSYPAPQETLLPNGLRLVVLSLPRQPVVSLTLTVPAGSVFDPPELEGTADLLAGLLTRGAGDRSAADIEQLVGRLGGALSATAEPDVLTIQADFLSDHSAEAFGLVGDMVTRPVLVEAELASLRERTVRTLQQGLEDPASLGARVFLLATYRKHPYARRPTPKSVAVITRADLTAFHQARVRPAGSTLTVAGNITLAEARRLATSALGGWKGLRPAALAATPLGPLPRGIALVHQGGATAASIIVGEPTFAATDSVYYAALVLNQILGDARSGRLARVLGRERGWTGVAGSSFLRTARLGLFQASTVVSAETADSTLVEILAQFERLRTDLVPARELERAREGVAGRFAVEHQTAGQLGAASAEARALGLPASYLSTFRRRVSAVTAAQVRAAARRILPANSLAIVVVGDGARLYRPLAALRPTQIFAADGRPVPPEEVEPTVAPFAVRAALAASRVDSLVILAQGATVGLQVSQMTRGGDSLIYTERTAIGTGISQATTVVFDTTGRMRTLTQTGKVREQETRISLRYGGGRVQGDAQVAGAEAPRQFAVDTAVSPTVVDDNAIQALLPFLDWKLNTQWRFEVFAGGENTIRQMTLTAADIVRVNVPAGQFEAYRADLHGAAQVVSFYITTTPPHRVVRVSLSGSPVEFLAVNR